MNSSGGRFVLFLLSLLCFAEAHARNQGVHQKSTQVQPDSAKIQEEFKERQAKINRIVTAIEEENYKEAIRIATALIPGAKTSKDTVALRDAYKLVSQVYHFTGDIPKRDHYHRLHQELASAFGVHFDELLQFPKSSNPTIADRMRYIFDEIQILEDEEGSYSLEQVMGNAAASKFTSNFTIPPGEKLYGTRNLDPAIYGSIEPIFNQDAVYWARLKLTGSANQQSTFFLHPGIFWGASWEIIDLFVVSGNDSVERFHFGLSVPANKKYFKYNQNYFEVSLSAGESKTIFLRLEGSRKEKLSVWRPDHIGLVSNDINAQQDRNGYYFIRDSISHVHDYSLPRRLNHILSGLNFIAAPSYNAYEVQDVIARWNEFNPSFPYQLIGHDTAAYYWGKLSIINTARFAGEHSFLMPEQWDDIEIYIPNEDGSYTTYYSGNNLRPSKKTIPSQFNIFRVRALEGDTVLVYFKFKSNRVFLGALTSLNKFEVFHFYEAQLWKDRFEQSIWVILVIGALFIQLLYYFILFFINREKYYFYLTFFFFGLFLASLNSANIAYWFQSNQVIQLIGISFTFYGLFRFSESILTWDEEKGWVKTWIKRINQVIHYGLILLATSFTAYAFYRYYFDAIDYSNENPFKLLNVPIWFIGGALVVLLIQAVYASFKRKKFAHFFLVFYVVLLASSVALAPVGLKLLGGGIAGAS